MIFPFFNAFFPHFSLFLRFSLLLLKRTRANNSNLLQKWGISLRPRLHRPRAKLPEFDSPENVGKHRLGKSVSEIAGPKRGAEKVHREARVPRFCSSSTEDGTQSALSALLHLPGRRLRHFFQMATRIVSLFLSEKSSCP